MCTYSSSVDKSLSHITSEIPLNTLYAPFQSSFGSQEGLEWGGGRLRVDSIDCEVDANQSSSGQSWLFTHTHTRTHTPGNL